MATLKFGAFPRSGSHFFLHLTNCEWLDHRIEPLAIEKNVVVSIRNPLECVPSWITLTGDKRKDRAEKVLEWYCAYYSKCAPLDLIIIPFQQLIHEPLFCIDYISNHYKIKIPVNKNLDLSSNFHYPSKDKSGFEDIVQEILESKSFTTATKIYERLCVPVG
jgi:hypothetical protein